MFCGCELTFGEPAQHAHLPGLPRPARQPAGRQRARRASRADDRHGARLRAGAALDLPPQELLLSRPAQGLPDLPVRRAPVPRRQARRRAHPPRAPGGGRREADPRGRQRPDPRLGRLASSTSTAAARRWRRSSPSPTCARAEQAGEWLRLLRTTLRQLGVSDVNMEEGSLRCDANISLRPAGSRRPRRQDRAEEHELLPLPRTRDQGRDPAPARRSSTAAARSTQETLHFDPASGAITSLRSKEEAHDYRYFPEPDLVPVAIDQGMIEAAQGDDGRASRRAGRAPRPRARAEHRGRRSCSRSGPSSATTSSSRSPPAPIRAPAAGAGELGLRRARRTPAGRAGARRLAEPSRPPWRSSSASSPPGRSA